MDETIGGVFFAAGLVVGIVLALGLWYWVMARRQGKRFSFYALLCDTGNPEIDSEVDEWLKLGMLR